MPFDLRRETIPLVVDGLSIESYHATKSAISKSGLDDIERAPSIYYGRHLDPKRPPEKRDETPGQRFGNLVHCAVLEWDEFHRRYRVGPDVHNKNVKAWQSFKAECEAEDAQAIDSAEYEAVARVRASVMEHPELKRLLSHGRPEVSAFWEDPATGVLCRCRPDWVHDLPDLDILVDVKTYASADPWEFQRQVARMRYDVQAAFYSDGWQHATRRPVGAFLFAAIEAKYPHACNVMMLDDDSMRAGGRKYRRNLDTYSACLKSGVWPGYGDSITTISLPHWAKEEDA